MTIDEIEKLLLRLSPETAEHNWIPTDETVVNIIRQLLDVAKAAKEYAYIPKELTSSSAQSTYLDIKMKELYHCLQALESTGKREE